ncbi:hypothetical protein C6P08_06835 [Weissella confusa]|uniref:hypothetical protein n=1 Tax=Weissella confusa TaxID=1583 RepID=UPI001091B890|nr:hypothetical protein [Weissella confusa]MBJ7694278.1 hypothetical protein [Weissella confusa]QBZ04913.1 hypothetical protein C6P08_06835 [Weissella confusa]
MKKIIKIGALSGGVSGIVLSVVFFWAVNKRIEVGSIADWVASIGSVVAIVLSVITSNRAEEKANQNKTDEIAMKKSQGVERSFRDIQHLSEMVGEFLNSVSEIALQERLVVDDEERSLNNEKLRRLQRLFEAKTIISNTVILIPTELREILDPKSKAYKEYTEQVLNMIEIMETLTTIETANGIMEYVERERLQERFIAIATILIRNRH